MHTFLTFCFYVAHLKALLGVSRRAFYYSCSNIKFSFWLWQTNQIENVSWHMILELSQCRCQIKMASEVTFLQLSQNFENSSFHCHKFLKKAPCFVCFFFFPSFLRKLWNINLASMVIIYSVLAISVNLWLGLHHT